MILLIKEPSGKPIAQRKSFKTTHILNTKISQNINNNSPRVTSPNSYRCNYYLCNRNLREQWKRATVAGPKYGGIRYRHFVTSGRRGNV